MSGLPDRLVGRHLCVLASVVFIFTAICAVNNPVASLLAIFLPAASLVAARAVSVPFGEPAYVRGFRWAAMLALALGVLSVQAPIPGPATLTALGFLWIGASRGSALLAGVSFAAACALMPLDITGPVHASAQWQGSVGHLSALGVVALLIGSLAFRSLRHRTISAGTNESAGPAPR